MRGTERAQGAFLNNEASLHTRVWELCERGDEQNRQIWKGLLMLQYSIWCRFVVNCAVNTVNDVFFLSGGLGIWAFCVKVHAKWSTGPCCRLRFPAFHCIPIDDKLSWPGFVAFTGFKGKNKWICVHSAARGSMWGRRGSSGIITHFDHFF